MRLKITFIVLATLSTLNFQKAFGQVAEGLDTLQVQKDSIPCTTAKRPVILSIKLGGDGIDYREAFGSGILASGLLEGKSLSELTTNQLFQNLPLLEIELFQMRRGKRIFWGAGLGLYGLGLDKELDVEDKEQTDEILVKPFIWHLEGKLGYDWNKHSNLKVWTILGVSLFGQTEDLNDDVQTQERPSIHDFHHFSLECRIGYMSEGEKGWGIFVSPGFKFKVNGLKNFNINHSKYATLVVTKRL